MRIGIVRPGINGLGIGDAPGPDASYVIADLLNQAAIDPGGGPTPDQLKASLQQILQSNCITWPNSCPAPGAITAAVDDWSAEVAARNAANPSTYAGASWGTPAWTPWGATASSSPSPSPSESTPSSQVQYSSQPPNALDRVTPQTSQVQPTPVSSVLSPPQTPAPVSATNAGSSTGTKALATGPGGGMTEMLSSSISIGGIEIPVWVLAGAAAFGIYLMSKGK